jgi:5-methyltetrahydrofolate--homocysteine methyltransferase
MQLHFFNNPEAAMEFQETLKQQIIVIDGAMGTQIQNLGLTDEDFGGPEYRMLSDLVVFAQPEALKGIHLDYLKAGANAIETNTFGASPMRLGEYDFSGLDVSRFAGAPEGVDLRAVTHEEFAYHLNRRAAAIAAEARDTFRADPAYDGRPLFVLGSMGPSNRVLSSTDADLTVSTFDEIMANSYHQVRGLVEGGADVLLFETQQDILELKAAIMGGQQAMAELGKHLPIMAQVTVDSFSRMQIFNTDILAAMVTVQGIGIDTFGINCSTGPDLMAKTVEALGRFCPLPVSVVPNAGLPSSEGGKTVFKYPPEEMADLLLRYVTEYGVTLIGGCCGTTPEHTRAMAEAVRGLKPKARTPERGRYISGPQEAVLLDSSEDLIRIGERLNVRGSKKVRVAVESGDGIDFGALEDVVHDQTHELGLKVIDVCMDSNVVDTTETLKQVVHKQTTDLSGAMCIDSFATEAIIEAVKMYPGRPILNSISMEEVEPGVTKADAVLRATAAHNPMYIALAAGPEGPAATAEGKVELARQLVAKAAEHGVVPGQLLIDMNVFPIGAESEEGMNFALESINAIPGIKALHPDLMTVCGVGNLTNGLAKKPYMRTVLTSVWLDEARKKGLDAAIINPNHYVYVDNLEREHYTLGLQVILEHDMDAFARLEEIAEAKQGITTKRRTTYDDLDQEEAICAKIKDGHKQREHGSVEVDGNVYHYADKIVVQAAAVVKNHAPLEFINAYLMRAMNELGDGFARGEVSLPHLLKSADVMKQVMGFLEEYMRVSAGIDVHDEIKYKGTIVLGTVYQDVHSIGKDLAKTLFENYGYRVVDLGVMTPLQKFVDSAREHNADAVGMSALLVQTSNHMITVAQMMQEQGLETIPLLIGGAPVNTRHAAYVAMSGGSDTGTMRSDVFYCATAMDGVNTMNALRDAGQVPQVLEGNRVKLVTAFERAEAQAQRDEELLRTLPVRAVSFEDHAFPPDPWVTYKAVLFRLRDFKEHLDTKTLFALNWKFGGTASRTKQGETPEKLMALFDDWVEHADYEGWIRPMGLWGIFPCQSEGDDVVVYDPADFDRVLCRLSFARVIGSRRKDTICAAQYFHPKDSGEMDVLGLQITTSGPQASHQIDKFRRDGDSESCLYLQGLSDRVAEDMAGYIHANMRQYMGYDPKRGTRWSPGYPAMPDTAYNRCILDTLHAPDIIGVGITDAGEFTPPGTTAAVVSFHPKARYT